VDAEHVNEGDGKWWRVEVNAKGDVTGCTNVEGSLKRTARVLYVQATTKVEACAEAKRWYERKLAKQREINRRNEARRKAAGKCRSCRNPLAPNSVRFCAAHLEKGREYQRRFYSGEAPPRQPVDPLAVHEREKALRRRKSMMRVSLIVILQNFDRLDGRMHSPFRQWLVLEIGARGEVQATASRSAAA
jgi:hypothetical protein